MLFFSKFYVIMKTVIKLNERINTFAESKQKKTEIVSGEIFTRIGNYERRLNTKTASGIAFCGEIINLPDYTAGEKWEQVAVNYGIISMTNSSQILNLDINIVWLTQDHNSFKFEGRINGALVTNQIQISWFCREEMFNITGVVFSPKESQNIRQTVTYRLPSKPSRILSVTTNTGRVVSYTQPDSNNNMTVIVDEGSIYKTYSVNKTYKESYSGGAHPTLSKKFTENIHNSSVGEVMTYSSTLNAAQEITLGGEQQVGGIMFHARQAQDIPIGTIVAGENHGKDINKYFDISDYTYVCEKIYYGYINYKNVYTFNKKRVQVARTRNLTFSGNLFANSRFYVITVRYLGG